MPRWSRFVHARPICPDSLSGNPLISGPSHNGNPSFADRGEACGARSHYPQGTTALHENDLVAQKRTDRSMPAKSLFASPRSYPPERGQPVLLRKRHKLSSEVSICTKEKPRRSGLKVGFVPDSACEQILVIFYPDHADSQRPTYPKASPDHHALDYLARLRADSADRYNPTRPKTPGLPRR